MLLPSGCRPSTFHQFGPFGSSAPSLSCFPAPPKSRQTSNQHPPVGQGQRGLGTRRLAAAKRSEPGRHPRSLHPGKIHRGHKYYFNTSFQPCRPPGQPPAGPAPAEGRGSAMDPPRLLLRRRMAVLLPAPSPSPCVPPAAAPPSALHRKKGPP